MPVETFTAQSSTFQSDSLLVWDTQRYYDLYQQTLHHTQDQELAYRTVHAAVTNDGLGLVTEKISSEKDHRGKYYFNEQERIVLQLTPAQHQYYELTHPETGELLMVPPELLEAKKDVMSLLSNWRRGIDRQVMGAVRDQFLSPEAEQLRTFVWTSTRATKDEGDVICTCNGKYGWLYVGQEQVDEQGRRKMVVHNYKYEGDEETALSFIHKAGDKVHYAHQQTPDRLGDEVMTTIAEVPADQDWDAASVWQRLFGVQQEVTGSDRIFGLSLDTVLKAQNPQLHLQLKETVATSMAHWVVEQMKAGVSSQEIQAQTRDKFISTTRASMDIFGVGKGKTGSSEGYTGSDGDSCGTWDKPSSGKGFETGDGCQEIQCKKCGWKPKSYEMDMIKAGRLTRCPGKDGERCGWSPSASSYPEIVVHLN